MSKSFFYLYLAGGTIALGLLVYDLISNWPNVLTSSLLFDILAAILLYYLAFKTYHEKKDKELM